MSIRTSLRALHCPLLCLVRAHTTYVCDVSPQLTSNCLKLASGNPSKFYSRCQQKVVDHCMDKLKRTNDSVRRTNMTNVNVTCATASALMRSFTFVHATHCFGAKNPALNSDANRTRSVAPSFNYCPASLLSSHYPNTFLHLPLNNFYRNLSTISSKKMDFTGVNNKFLCGQEQSTESEMAKVPQLVIPKVGPEISIIPDKKDFRIIVEGNIGCGKTTFLSIFQKNSSSLSKKPLVVTEPIHRWRDVGGVNIFQLMVDDPKRWSFAFQSFVQLTMVQVHELHSEEGNSIKVMERSLYSARYCFVENLFRKGLLTKCEYHILDEIFKNSLRSAGVDLIIYLRADPNIVYERIKKRARPEESSLQIENIRVLHELHEDWLIKQKFPLPAPVITIDASIPLEKIMSIYEEKTGGILREHMTV